MTIDAASYDRSWPVTGDPPSISFGMTLVMAIACGVAAANIYYNQPMLGILEAAFPDQIAVANYWLQQNKNVTGKDLKKEAPRSPRIRIGGYAILLADGH